MSEHSGSQWKGLPVTTSVVVTEQDRLILGLRGFGIFFVFAAFGIVVVATDNFPIALAASIATFVFMKRYVDGKPRHWLRHVFEYYLILPKYYRHRPERSPVRKFDLP